jgi:DNA-binding transcriptional MerR regulator
MKFEALKVGELAKRTGLTVRTLHHYDEIGLLKPSQHTDAGYRLYARADLVRLQQILSLKMLGFGLEQIREYLSRDDYDPRQVVRMHRDHIRGQADELKQLADRLTALADALDKAGEVSADEFLQTIKVMTMFEKYYTPEQMAKFEARAKEVGQEVIDQAPQWWADLFASVEAAMDAGVPPEDAKAQALAKRWLELVTMCTRGDPGIFNSMRSMYENEENVMGTDTNALRPKMEYIMNAAAAAGIKHPGQ